MSTWNAGRFYSDKITEARALTPGCRTTTAIKTARACEFREQGAAPAVFVAEMGLRPAPSWPRAEGAVNAYAVITGETWKPYVGPDNNQTLSRQAAVAELDAFGE
jgi:hypothetical protein